MFKLDLLETFPNILFSEMILKSDKSIFMDRHFQVFHRGGVEISKIQLTIEILGKLLEFYRNIFGLCIV